MLKKGFHFAVVRVKGTSGPEKRSVVAMQGPPVHYPFFWTFRKTKGPCGPDFIERQAFDAPTPATRRRVRDLERKGARTLGGTFFRAVAGVMWSTAGASWEFPRYLAGAYAMAHKGGVQSDAPFDLAGVCCAACPKVGFSTITGCSRSSAGSLAPNFGAVAYLAVVAQAAAASPVRPTRHLCPGWCLECAEGRHRWHRRGQGGDLSSAYLLRLRLRC